MFRLVSATLYHMAHTLTQFLSSNQAAGAQGPTSTYHIDTVIEDNFYTIT